MNINTERAEYNADLEAKRWCRYVPKHERPVLSALIKKVIDDGYTISVNDGEETVVTRSTDKALVRSRLGHTGEDTITIRNDAEGYIGFFFFIYNNGSDGDPMVVISDYAANEYCDEVCNMLSARYDS